LRRADYIPLHEIHSVSIQKVASDPYDVAKAAVVEEFRASLKAQVFQRSVGQISNCGAVTPPRQARARALTGTRAHTERIYSKALHLAGLGQTGLISHFHAILGRQEAAKKQGEHPPPHAIITLLKLT
jgi:hypothetical protein